MSNLQNAKSSMSMVEASMRYTEGDPNAHAVAHAQIATAYALIALVEKLDQLSVPDSISDSGGRILLVADADKK